MTSTWYSGVWRVSEFETLEVEVVAELMAERAKERAKRSDLLTDGGAHPHSDHFGTRGGSPQKVRSPSLLFDLLSLDPDLCLLAIADVSGKGPAAALQATMLHGITHAVARHSKKLSDLMRTADQCFRERAADNCFATAFLATVDNRGRLRYSNAGHNAPLHIQSSGRVTELTEGSVPMGILDKVSYPEATVQLGPGDLLVLYTDGLTDSENGPGETFGAARVLDWAGRQWQRPAAEAQESQGGKGRERQPSLQQS